MPGRGREAFASSSAAAGRTVRILRNPPFPPSAVCGPYDRFRTFSETSKQVEKAASPRYTGPRENRFRTGAGGFMAEGELERIAGYVDHIIFRNETNGYTVFVLVEKKTGKETTVTGMCRDLDIGENVELQGEFVQNPTYGRQFHLSSYHVVQPSDVEGMERYLASGAIKGVGAALAAKIIRHFGEDTFRVIEEEPELLAQIKGISTRKAMEIAVQMEEKRELRDAMVFLGKFQISQAMAVRIYEAYGPRLYNIIRENPYRLAQDIQGIGFQTADRIAAEMGMSNDSEFRIRCGFEYALSQSIAEGHSYLPVETAVSNAAQLLGVEPEEVQRELDALLIERRVIIRDGRAYTSLMYNAECDCARMLFERNLKLKDLSAGARKAFEERIAQVAGKNGMTADPLQIEAVQKCVENGIFLLTGGPGTGKTTTINLVIRYFMEEGMDLLLAAPTGRAAKRMTEATGFEATTIHRLLEVGGDLEDGHQGKFQKGADNPLEADVIIIDEMSMVDLLLFRALLSAIVPGTRIILVGDASQLPSVGAGQVFRDLLGSECFAMIRLNRIFRQAEGSDIVKNAHLIDQGRDIPLDTNSRDFLFLERNDEKLIRQIMVWMVRDKLPEYCHAGLLDIQVLTPMRKGALGCVELNTYLQEVLNPPAKDKAEILYQDTVFREGDKVMQVRNNYRQEWTVTGLYGVKIDSGLGVFNGDMGRIRKIEADASGMEVEFDDGRVSRYGGAELADLELAYAITIHKSQGSEYPAVVIPILDPPMPLQYRNLLYTGVTRAKSCVVLLGSAERIRRMIGTEGERRRYSSLQERIREAEGLG